MKRKWQTGMIVSASVLALLLASGSLFLPGRWESRETLAVCRYPQETVVIDAGHGGEDGGAVSVSGVAESGINLAVAKRLDQLLGLYGVRTVLLRSEDVSLHDSSATTLREKKVSDLHNRVERIEATANATLISIHQNTYQSAKYHGAQVFYREEEESLPFAAITQENLRTALDPGNTRTPAKIPESVYLMNHIHCRAILVECGFLSNPEEDKKLQSGAYQTKIAAALCGSYLQLHTEKGEASDENKGSILLYPVWQRISQVVRPVPYV